MLAEQCQIYIATVAEENIFMTDLCIANNINPMQGSQKTIPSVNLDHAVTKAMCTWSLTSYISYDPPLQCPLSIVLRRHIHECSYS